MSAILLGFTAPIFHNGCAYSLLKPSTLLPTFVELLFLDFWVTAIFTDSWQHLVMDFNLCSQLMSGVECFLFFPQACQLQHISFEEIYAQVLCPFPPPFF